MAFLHISDVYYNIQKTLQEDEVIRGLMGFDEKSSPVEKARRIQKRIEPVGLSEGHFPIVSFYKLPGRRGSNHLEYQTAFVFDIYTKDDVETAIEISDRISDLFDDEYLPMKKGSSFKGEYLTSSEQPTDLSNTYKYYAQILFTFGIEG